MQEALPQTGKSSETGDPGKYLAVQKDIKETQSIKKFRLHKTVTFQSLVLLAPGQSLPTRGTGRGR